jgi:hypothetical protein
MEDTKKKLRTICTAGSIISALFIVALAIALIACVIIGLVAPDIIDNFEGVEVVGDVTSSEIRILATVLIVNIIISGIMFILLYKMFQNMRGATPFTDENVRTMKLLAIILFIFAILAPVMNAVANSMMDNVSIPEWIGLEMIIGAAIFYCLSLIFQYGTELQKESDQTL